MRKIALLALTTVLSTATAATGTVSGSQTTNLTLTVNNTCIAAFGGFNNGSQDLNKGNTSTLNLPAISALTKKVVTGYQVLALDCNYKTAITPKFPESIVLTNQNGDTFNINNAAWSTSNPLSVQFRKEGSYTPNWDGVGNYEFHRYVADFELGGSGNGYQTAWSIPGGNYTGTLTVDFTYNE